MHNNQNVPDTWAERNRLQRRGAAEEVSGWPLVVVGALGVLLIAVVGLESEKVGLIPFSVPVAVPAMLFGYAAVLIPPALFVIYNIALLGKNISKANRHRHIIAAVVITLVSVLTVWFYAPMWRNADTPPYQWAMFNAVLALCTWSLFFRSTMRKSPNSLVLTNLMMFLWFFSYAFPWSGAI